MESEKTCAQDLSQIIRFAALDDLLALGRANSLWPLTFGLACCAIEMMAAGASRFDISRFGAEVFRPSPRQADVLFVVGTVNEKLAPVLKRVYDQMCEPKWVVSFGVCATSGGFYDNYATVQGIDKIIPVDIYIPGCPPRTEALADGMRKVQEIIMREDWRGKRRPIGPQPVPQAGHGGFIKRA